MMRLITILLLVAGIGLIGWGGWRYYAAIEPGYANPTAERTPRAVSPPPAPVEAPAFSGDGNTTFSAASVRPAYEGRLRTVPIAHETPTTARYNRAFEVTVAIDATGDDTAADALPGEGNVVEDEAEVLDKAQATLSGWAFEIEAVSPPVQRLSTVTENVWRWKVTPLETGSHQLRIELFAIEEDEALPVRTFTDTVEVEVSRLGQVIAAAEQYDPLFMVLGGAGSVLAGLFGLVRFFRRR